MCTYIWNFKSMISVYKQFIHLKHLFKLKTDKIQTLLLVPFFSPILSFSLSSRISIDVLKVKIKKIKKYQVWVCSSNFHLFLMQP